MRYSRLGYWGSAAIATAILVAGVVLAMRLVGPGRLWIAACIFSATLVIGTCTALLAYRYADEVMLQTQKNAWFWGSLGAVIAIGPLLVPVSWGLVPIMLPLKLAQHPQAVFVLGMVSLFAIQGIGFAAAGLYQRWLR